MATATATTVSRESTLSTATTTATLAALTTATVPTRGLWSAAVAATTTDVSTTATNVSTAKEEKQDLALACCYHCGMSTRLWCLCCWWHLSLFSSSLQ